MRLVNLLEGKPFFNGREAGQHGIIGTDHYRMCRVGEYFDFYDRNGDKKYGKVVAKGSGTITFSVDGEQIQLKVGDTYPGYGS